MTNTQTPQCPRQGMSRHGLVAICLGLLALLGGCQWRPDYKADCSRWYAMRAEALISLGYQDYTSFDIGENSYLASTVDTIKLPSAARQELNEIDYLHKQQLGVANVRAFCTQYIKLEHS